MITDIIQYTAGVGGLGFILVKPVPVGRITISAIHWRKPITVHKSWLDNRDDSDVFAPFCLQFIY